MSLRVLDRKALRAKGVPYSNVHLLRLEAGDKFPKRFNLTENRVAWLEEEVDLWIRERVEASRGIPDQLAGGGDAQTAA